MANNTNKPSSHRTSAPQPSRYAGSSGQRRPTYSERYNRPNPYTGYLPPGVAGSSSDIYHPEGIDPVRARQLQREQLYKEQQDAAAMAEQARRQAQQAQRQAQEVQRQAQNRNQAYAEPAPEMQQKQALDPGQLSPHLQRRAAVKQAMANQTAYTPSAAAPQEPAQEVQHTAPINRRRTTKRQAVAAAQAASRAQQTRPEEHLRQIEKAAAAETATDVLLETMRKATAEAMQFREEFRRPQEEQITPPPARSTDAASHNEPPKRPRIEYADDDIPSALVLSRRKYKKKNGPSLRWSAPAPKAAAEPVVEAAEIVAAAAVIDAAADVKKEEKIPVPAPVVLPVIEEKEDTAPEIEIEETAAEPEQETVLETEETEETETAELPEETEEPAEEYEETEPEEEEEEETPFFIPVEVPEQTEEEFEEPEEPETEEYEPEEEPDDWDYEEESAGEEEEVFIPEDDDFDDDIVFEEDDEIIEDAEPEEEFEEAPEEEIEEQPTEEPEQTEEPELPDEPEEEPFEEDIFEEEEEDDVLIYAPETKETVSPEDAFEDADESEQEEAQDEPEETEEEPEEETETAEEPEEEPAEPEDEPGEAEEESEDEPEEEEEKVRTVMPVITPAPTNRRNFETRISAELAVPDYHPGVAQDETLFIRKKRPEAATAVFSATTPGLAPDVDDDDFFEQWLEEGDDMIIKDKRQRRRVSAIIGAVTMIFALIGFSFIVFKLVEGLPKKTTTSTKTNYASYILPVINADPEPFETVSASDNNVLVEAAINRLTYGEAASEHSYTAVDVEGETRLLLPLADVEESGKELFGPSFAVSISEMYTIDDEEMFYYSAADGCFHVVMTGSDMEPEIIKISRIGTGSQITLDVGYISDGAEIEDEDDYYKMMQYILDTTEDDYYISAIRQME